MPHPVQMNIQKITKKSDENLKEILENVGKN